MKVNLNTIKNWFRTGKKPTQSQFWATFDSFRHKDDDIPIDQIKDIDTLLQQKADAEELANYKQDVQSNIDNKVDKVTGKGLSANDFSDDEKSKLDGFQGQLDNKLPTVNDKYFQNFLPKETTYLTGGVSARGAVGIRLPIIFPSTKKEDLGWLLYYGISLRIIVRYKNYKSIELDVKGYFGWDIHRPGVLNWNRTDVIIYSSYDPKLIVRFGAENYQPIIYLGELDFNDMNHITISQAMVYKFFGQEELKGLLVNGTMFFNEGDSFKNISATHKNNLIMAKSAKEVKVSTEEENIKEGLKYAKQLVDNVLGQTPVQLIAGSKDRTRIEGFRNSQEVVTNGLTGAFYYSPYSLNSDKVILRKYDPFSEPPSSDPTFSIPFAQTINTPTIFLVYRYICPDITDACIIFESSQTNPLPVGSGDKIVNSKTNIDKFYFDGVEMDPTTITRDAKWHILIAYTKNDNVSISGIHKDFRGEIAEMYITETKVSLGYVSAINTSLKNKWEL